MLWEQSIHHFDLMRHVYGAECTGVAARTWNPPWSMYRGDANVAALLTFEGGIEVTYQGTWAANRNSLEFDWRTDCARGIAVQADMFGGLSWALRDDPAPTPGGPRPPPRSGGTTRRACSPTSSPTSSTAPRSPARATTT